MLNFSCRALLITAALLSLAGGAPGQDNPGNGFGLPAESFRPTAAVVDRAGLFGTDAVRKAIAAIEKLEADDHFAAVIETVESLRGVAIREEAERKAEALRVSGMFVLIEKQSHKFELVVSPGFQKAFPTATREAIRDAFLSRFKARDFDDGLADGIAAIEKALATARAEHRLPVAASAPSASTSMSAAAPSASPLVARGQVKLTLAGARQIIEAAEAKAGALGVKENIAVVDDGGHLIAFSRMDGARPASVHAAITKAASAATFRQETGPLPKGEGNPDVLFNLSLQHAITSGGGKMTTLLGGVPVLVDGQVVGGVGVGGATGEQDLEVAKAGVAKFAGSVAAPAPSPAPIRAKP